MSYKLESPNKTIIFISGIVGYSCQAALFDKKENFNIIKTTNGKNYIYSDTINYNLISMKYSFV